MSDELTAAQREVLQTISDYIKKEGLPPTLRELGDLLGIRSTNGVRDHLIALTKKGYLKMPTKWKQARGIVPVRNESVINEDLTNPVVRLAFDQDWLHQEFVTQLERCMREKKVTRKELAIKMGKTPAFVSKVMRNGHNLTLHTMVSLVAAVGCRIDLTIG